jgi:broad specificity phosphatase PhoE
LSQIFLIRHGEVEGNSGERPLFSGWNDLPLTPRGELQAQAVARRMQSAALRAVYCSDLTRARHTAEPIAAFHGLEVQASAAWREVNYGAWAGLDETQIVAGWNDLWQQRKANAENVRTPGGESYADVWQRFEPQWKAIVERHAVQQDEDIALVSHNGPIRVLLCHLLGMPVKNYRRLRIGNTSVSRIEVRPQKPAQTLSAHEYSYETAWSFSIASVNETSHLQGI